MELFRSWMFVPGYRQRMIDKALGLEADAVMLDIEDGVPPGEKETARRQIAASLDQAHSTLSREEGPGDLPSRTGHTPARYVRINAVGHQRMGDDLEAVLRPGLQGLVLPKVETLEQVKTVQEIVEQREPEVGIKPGTVRLLIAIESPRGLLNAAMIGCGSERVIGLMFGVEDFGKELGLPTRREGEARELIYHRSALVTAAAAAHIQAVEGVWPDLQDSQGLSQFALQSRRLGFTGMSLIHPSQIDPINAAFSPSGEEIEYAEQVVKAFEEAEARGEASIAFGGQLIDLPIVERARQTLKLAQFLKQ